MKAVYMIMWLAAGYIAVGAEGFLHAVYHNESPGMVVFAGVCGIILTAVIEIFGSRGDISKGRKIFVMILSCLPLIAYFLFIIKYIC